MEGKNLIGSVITVIGRSGLFNRAASRRGIRLAPLLLIAVMLAAVAVLAETSNPAQTAHAHGGEDHTHRCTSPPDERCTTYDHFAGGATQVWSATMTVGTRSVFHGWNDSGTYTGASLTDQDFTFGGDTYDLDEIQLGGSLLYLRFDSANLGDIATQATRDKLTLHIGSQSFNLGAGTFQPTRHDILWSDRGLTWAAGESVELKITEPPLPNAYGYRTIWTALMTAAAHPTLMASHGYIENSFGSLTNNLMVDGRDESITIGTDDQPRYPWTGYEITGVYAPGSRLTIVFDSNNYPSAEEVAGWTLTLGGGVELPFADATNLPTSPYLWNFSHVPGWTAGDQVLVSIRNDEVQNRVGQTAGEEERAGQVKFKVRRHTSTSGGNIVYGKTHFSYDHEPDKFGPADGWELRSLTVTTDKTGDTDPVWITATFRTHGSGAAGRARQGYWEGEFDDFHTLFLRWIYNVDGIGKGEATYTLPLRSAAKEGGISYRAKYDGRPDNYHVSGGHDVTFTWVRTYKEFKDKHLDLANHSAMSAHMLAPPQPARAGNRLVGVVVPLGVGSIPARAGEP